MDVKLSSARLNGVVWPTFVRASRTFHCDYMSTTKSDLCCFIFDWQTEFNEWYNRRAPKHCREQIKLLDKII